MYEYDMLVSTANAIAVGVSEPWLRNALLESFVIHFRALSDFFYPSQKVKPDDVLAADYFSDPATWDGCRPPLSPALSAGRIRAHKEIAHLTYERLNVAPEVKPWDVGSIAQEIHALMIKFQAETTKLRTP